MSELVEPADRPDAAAPSDVPATTSLTFPKQRVRALVHAWLILDFFTESRHSGQPSSSLTTTIFGQAFLALVFAALFFPDTPAGAFAAANLSISTLLVGIGHLGDDRGASRLRADRVLVSTSPLSAGAILAARTWHASFYVCLLTIGMALPPAILCAFLPGQGLATVPAYLGLACVCSALFTSALALLLRAFERAFGIARAQLVGGTLKALLLFGGLVAFALCARQLRLGREHLSIPSWMLQAWPPFHAGRALAGHLDGALILLAAFALLGLLVLPLVSEREGSASARVGHNRFLAAMTRHFAGANPPLHAIASFTSAMLYRSAAFRGRVLPLFGMPAGMWLLAFLDHDPATAQRLHALTAQLPGVYLPFLIGFLCVGDEPRARWIFATCPDLPIDKVRHGIAIALTTHVLVPVHAILLVVSIPNVGWLRALATSALALGMAILVGRAILRSFTDVPFSGTTAPPATEFGGLLTVALALTLVGLAAAALPVTLALVAGVGMLAGAYLSLRRRRRDPQPRQPVPERYRAPADPAEAVPTDPLAPPSPLESRAAAAPQPPSLHRELRAIVTLYVVVSILPLALGWLLGR